MILTFDKGDTVWFYSEQKHREYTEGKVVAILNLAGWGFCHYVIEVETSIDPVLYIRDGFTLSNDKNKPLGMYRDF
jgi:hypothetical protein